MKTNINKYIDLYQIEIQKVARSNLIFDLFKKELKISEIRISKNIDFECLQFSIEIYRDFCGLNERDYEFIHLFTNACSENMSLLLIYSVLKNICKSL